MNYLFSKGKLSEYLEERRGKLQAEVDNCDPDYLLKVSEIDFQEYLVSGYSLKSPRLLIDQIYQHEPRDVDIEVRREDVSWNRIGSVGNKPVLARSFYKQVTGTAITVMIPFDGDAELLEYQPSHFTGSRPQGEIIGQEIRLTYTLPTHDAEGLTQRYTQDLEEIQDYVNWVDNDVSTFNRSLSQIVQQAITHRKQKLLADRNMSAALGIPFKRREDASRTYAVPQVRRKATIQRPRVTTEEPFQPEPALADTAYENILEIIQNMVAVMERSPHAFAEMGEEDLRQHFLVQLNGQYEGQATGETFNYTGKTDILIRVNGKNIFIAECKFWKGPKGLVDTVDQLLSYASWRDTKTAILLFNRDRQFSTVLAKIPNAIENHPCFKRRVSVEEETVFRYVFHQPDDPNRELLLTILAFDIPQ